MSIKPKLYYMHESAPCRTVIMTAKVMGLDLELIHLDVRKGENLKSEFLKINPTHTIPTLVDGDFSLAESRCIITYLVDKYGKDDSLYPKELKKRYLINEKLYFDINTFFDPIRYYYRGVYMGSKTYDENKMPLIRNAFNLLNTYLEKSKFVVGNNLTVADIALTSSTTTAVIVFDFDLKPYPNVIQWFEIMKKILPGYKTIFEDNAKKSRIMIESLKAKNNEL